MERDELEILRRLLEGSGSPKKRETRSENQLLSLITNIADKDLTAATSNTRASDASNTPTSAKPADPLATLSLLARGEQTRRQSLDSPVEAEARRQTNSNTGGGAASTVLKTIGLVTGVGPVVAGLMTLFGGKSGGSPEPVELPVFAPPPSINVSAGLNSDRSISAVGYGAGGQLRPIAAETVTAAPTIQVHVQAMDSRSFIDHSGEIAAAVRRAMLQSNSLNDVVSEL